MGNRSPSESDKVSAALSVPCFLLWSGTGLRAANLMELLQVWCQYLLLQLIRGVSPISSLENILFQVSQGSVA